MKYFKFIKDIFKKDDKKSLINNNIIPKENNINSFDIYSEDSLSQIENQAFCKKDKEKLNEDFTTKNFQLKSCK
jgi:hypothetical protein